MLDLWHYLKKQNKPIVIYGMGNGADAIIDKLSSVGVEVAGIFASDEFVRGQNFRGHTVLTYDDIKAKFKNFIILTAFGSSLPSVKDRILKLASEQELYIADAPVYGKTFFDDSFVSAHKNQLLEVYESLSDTRSREVFENVVRFKLSGKPEFLFAAEDDEINTIKTLLPLFDNATIYDLGAFNGDTAEKFSTIWKNYGKIVAVEPSEHNYNRLVVNTKQLRNIEYVNAAIGYLNGNMFFGNEGGRNQSLHAGSKTTRCITIDSLCQRFGKPDFIKFDIEGEELNGIIGGEETIKKYKPALMISAYHRSEDIITIAKKVLSLRDDYRLYFRRFPSVPCWDTYYIFV